MPSNDNNFVSSVIGFVNRDGLRGPVDSIHLQVAMADHLFRRNWKKAEQLSFKMITYAFSEFGFLEEEYLISVRRKKLYDENCERYVKAGDEVKIALNMKILEKFSRRLVH
jgi:hypothetical protein